jgi:hypothetical protein
MKRLFFLLILTVFGAIAQNPAQPTPNGANGTFRVIGYVLTTTPTNLCSLSASASVLLPPSCSGKILYVCAGDVNASSGTSVSVTLRDGQGNYYWNGIAPLSTAAASSFLIPFGVYPFCRPFPSGILASASSNSTITLSISGYY